MVGVAGPGLNGWGPPVAHGASLLQSFQHREYKKEINIDRITLLLANLHRISGVGLETRGPGPVPLKMHKNA